MLRLSLVFLAAAVASGLGLPGPHVSGAAGPCLAPPQWEGRWVRYDHSTGRNNRASVSYDGLNQRVRVLQQLKKHSPCQRSVSVCVNLRFEQDLTETRSRPGLLSCSSLSTTEVTRQEEFFEYIYLYQSSVMFQIDQKTKDCSKITLTESWDPFDIPDNSTFEDQYLIGGPGDSVEVQEWSDRKPARKHETWVGVYTLKDCYPVQETYAWNSSVTTSTRFFNLQLGISDPNVFTPPSTCQSARPEGMSESDC
ncbi:unnamed protein product [Pleuronectes platessa]|uniref:Mammalian ependymin-related protein 1 n=1 Tax=Pleuronectes platessa TaxID=8262 RepID=A0A9N7Z1S2_PLEPL|nr:unnamed protein product [Pleuronectes platessa]